MPTPEQFYYAETGSQVQYTSRPSGEINFERIIESNPNCFIAGTTAEELKQKKLILADWTARSWNEEKNALVIKELQKLVEQGFSLYMWQEGEVIELTQDTIKTLDDVSVREKIRVEFPEKIIKTAITQHKLTQDNAFVLDDYWIERILNPDTNTPEHILKTTPFWSLKPSEKKLLEEIVRRSSNINIISFDKLTVQEIKGQHAIESFAANCGIKTDWQIDTLIFNEKSVEQHPQVKNGLKCTKKLGFAREHGDTTSIVTLLKGIEFKHVENLTLISCPKVSNYFLSLKPNDLSQLKELYINLDTLTVNNVNALMQIAPNLEKFKITSKITGDLFALNWDQGNFQKLKILEMASDSITGEGVKTLLRMAPRLEELNLNHCKNITGVFTPLNLAQHNLKTLKVLRLTSTDISHEDMKAVLQLAPNLEELHLTQDLVGVLSSLNLDKGSLKQLKVLKMDSCTISTADLKALLDLAPNLEILEFNNGKIINSALPSSNWGQKRFEKLSDLSLLNTSIPIDSLKALLKAVPAVKQLTIDSRDVNGHGFSFLTPENRKSVKNLSLSQSVITADELAILFKSLSETEVFDLRECSTIKGILNLERGELPKFNELSFLSLTITAHNFTTLLLALSNVQTIVLSRDTRIQGSLTHLEPGSLDKLQNYYISASSINLLNLTVLLKAAPNLKKLDLQNCQNIRGALSLEPGSLSHLKVLNIKASSITAENLKVLVKAAPNLKKIELFNNFTEEEIKALQLAYPLIEIIDISAPQSNVPVQPGMGIANTVGYDSFKNDTPEKIDADTEPAPNQKYYANRIFYSLDGSAPPPVHHYRLGVANAFTINQKPCKPYDAFEISAKGDLQLNPCTATASQDDLFKLGSKIKKKAGHDCIYGKQQFLLSSHWLAIPSLVAGEELVHYHAHPTTNDIEIKYSERDNQYYIKSHSGQSHHVTLDFLLQVPKEQKKLPAAVNKVVKEFRNFGAKALKISKEQPTGEDYFQYILDQKTGACRHRSFAFMAKMKKEAPEIPVRIVNNISHSFVEIKVDGQWVTCDLGGYPGGMEITENYVPNRPSDDDHTPFVPPAPIIELLNYPKNPYDSAMQTWRKKVQLQPELSVYLQSLVQPSEQKNRLVQLHSEEEVIALTASIQKHCQSIQRPVFYLHSPDDIVCASHFLKREKNIGVITKGPGGDFYDFLKTEYRSDNPPILLINYSRFTPADLVRLNTLVDKHRSADGTEIPEEALVIGVINTGKPDCYQGSDFYSRFDRIDTNPFAAEDLHQVLIPIADTTVDSIHLNLYHAADWKPRLLGSWRLDKGQLVFHEGLLPKALKKARLEGKALTLNNGLWEDPDFVFFWQQALLTGHIPYAGGEPLDVRELTLHKGQGYDWNLLQQQCSIIQAPSPEAKLLNPSTLSDFFSRFDVSASKSLISTPGFIKDAIDELEVHVTRTLREDDWARLVTECQKKKITLKISLAPGVVMPQQLHAAPTPLPQALPWNAAIDNTTQVIISSDPDTTVDLLTQGSSKDWVVLDVSECHSSDLLLYTKPELITTPQPHLEFTQTKRIVLTALTEGKSVVLKGQFSAELTDALTALVLKRQQQGDKALGQLILVSDTKQHLECIPGHYTHPVTLAEKQAALKAPIRPEDAATPLSTLKSKLHFPNSWDGLKTIEQAIKPLAPFNPKSSATQAAAFNTTRKEQVWEVLETSPYVYIAGLSGVGKSTFVEKELFKGIQHKPYVGEADRERWAQDKDDASELKILFIDEENLSGKQWSEFEGLFNTPPVILINGVYHKLTPQHKVIFAGNPVSYGDERTLSPFFVRHGRAVVFDPLPLAVIYEQILKPVFTHTAYTSKSADICQPIMDVYTFLCSQSTREILISPRELQMMALLTASYCQRHPTASPELVAKHYAYIIAKPLVPEPQCAAFEQRFAVPAITPLPIPSFKAADFKMTASRQPVTTLLNDFLTLRETKREAHNEEQRHGGLGGIIFEGEPGIGKSELVMALLRAHDFNKATLQTPAADLKPGKTFYHMNVSLSLPEKTTLLLKAFHEGAVVVIDEINSSPMMERLLNELLMGKTPDKKPAKNAGFMVIGTQNPVTMAGRRCASTALSRRLCTVKLPVYSKTEMLEILNHDVVSDFVKKKMEQLVDAYILNADLAARYHYSPAPTFRDVLRLAHSIKEHAPVKEAKACERLQRKQEMRVQLGMQIDKILNQFHMDIQAIGTHNPAAKHTAQELLTHLRQCKNKAFTEPTKQSLETFGVQVKESIAAARPELQRDLGWGDYLMNMAKNILNVITKAIAYLFTLGTSSHKGFFSLTSSPAVTLVNELESKVEKGL